MITPPLRVGSVFRARGREWVLLPSPDPQLALLRPLTGSEAELCGIYLPLVQRGVEKLEPAEFPLPTPDDAADAVAAELLWNAARLSLRDGAGPFRSLGRISVRPRPYQFVPLLMALRLHPVRLLIADDVGVGKTIEALLIARELLARGEIRRIAILCPPYLCDQWQQELADILDPWEEVAHPQDPRGYEERRLGSTFPGETFRVLKEKELRQYGECRTRRHVLEAWEK